jgi:ribosome-binding protein aMBF1 (putative translation factor)
MGKEKKQTTYERLSTLAGIKDPVEHKKNIFGSAHKEELKKQEVTLRELVDKKFDKFIKEDVRNKRDDLVDNFHWVIMRARRHRKMSVSQLARDIGEPERVVKLAEQGILPEGYDVVMKLETVLGINLLKPGVAESVDNQPKSIGFDKLTSRRLTISDLKEMKENDPGIDLGVDKGLGGLGSGKKKPYWRTALSKIMNRRRDKENEIIVQEIGKQKEKEEFDKPEKEAELDETPKGVSESAEFDETSLEITTTFPGRREVATAEEIEEASESVEKQEKQEKSSTQGDEMTQDEIDDLIFGRK